MRNQLCYLILPQEWIVGNGGCWERLEDWPEQFRRPTATTDRMCQAKSLTGGFMHLLPPMNSLNKCAEEFNRVETFSGNFTRPQCQYLTVEN